MAALTDADKVLRNDTGLAIVSKLEDIADALGGESIIDDTSASSTKTWSSQLESTIVGGSTYNSSSTYNKGDTVIHNGTLYDCKDNSVTGTWNASHWDATTLQPKTDNTLSTTDKTVVGAINEVKSNSEYHVGDTINISNLQLVGLITSGQKSIYIQLPLPKAIGSDVNTITLNANALFYIRHVSGGYIINNQTLTSIGTVTLKKNISGIFIGVDMTNAFTGCPNNTPLVISTGEGANDYITFS